MLLCSDHGQTPVTEPVRLQSVFAGLRIFRRAAPGRADVAVTASNRAGMVYRLDSCSESARQLARRLDGVAWADAVCFLEDGNAVARRAGEEERFGGEEDGPLFDFPDGKRRVWAALNTPSAGDVLVSAAAGFEFADLGGGHHAGGGSHGSLLAGDSTVPVVAVGLDPDVGAITEIQAAVLGHFGVALPPYAPVRGSTAAA